MNSSNTGREDLVPELMTAYRTSVPTGEMAGTVRVLRYDVRGQVHHAPTMLAPPETRRTPRRGAGAGAEVVITVVGEAVHFPERPGYRPVPYKRGKRTIVGAVNFDHGRHIFVKWKCECGCSGKVDAHRWRRERSEGCRSCSKGRKLCLPYGRKAMPSTLWITAPMTRKARRA